MKRIALLTSLLVAGLLASQIVPAIWGDLPKWGVAIRQFLTMSMLAYIMISVGREFEIDMKNKKRYAFDYGVAATVAAFPWIFCTIYFLMFLMPETSSTGKPIWAEAVLAARFAAPTSAGVLFSMLAAAGLAGTWAFRKTQILAIFDDLDTVLFMIPLKIIMVGFVWQLGADLFIAVMLLILGIRYYRKINLPQSWPWILVYSFLITGLSETVYYYTRDPDTLIGAHIEVLLPAFLLGCALKLRSDRHLAITKEETVEERISLLISCLFMLLVGLSMPTALGVNAVIKIEMSVVQVVFHVLAVTILSNIGKMFAAFCYRKEASLKERLAVSISMFPRGEVGAGVLAISLSYGIKGPFMAIGFLSLALNLLLTGLFIVVVKHLLAPAKDKIFL